MNRPIYSFPFIRNNSYHQRRWQGHMAIESFHFKNVLPEARPSCKMWRAFCFLQNDDGRERLGWHSLPSPRVDLRRVPCRISWGGYFGKCCVFFSSKVGLIFSFLSSRKVGVALDPSWDFDIHQTCSSFSEICRNRKIGPYFRKMQCAGETSS